MDDEFQNIMDGSPCGVLRSEGRGVLSQTSASSVEAWSNITLADRQSPDLGGEHKAGPWAGLAQNLHIEVHESSGSVRVWAVLSRRWGVGVCFS